MLTRQSGPMLSMALFPDSIKADLRGGGRGRPSRQIRGVNSYQEELEESYADWADEISEALAKETDAENQKKIIDEKLALLLILLIGLGRRRIPDALELGMDDEPPTPEALRKLAEILESNERFLTDSLIPAIRQKLENAFADTDIILAIQMGEGDEVIRAVLQTLHARVASYAGPWWIAWNWGSGFVAGQMGKKIVAHLDPTAQHCEECPEFQAEGGRIYNSWAEYLMTTGGRTPGQFKCKGNCRCWILPVED